MEKEKFNKLRKLEDEPIEVNLISANFINEEELDKLANEYVGNYGCEHYDDGVEAYKAGYRKGIEAYGKNH